MKQFPQFLSTFIVIIRIVTTSGPGGIIIDEYDPIIDMIL